MPPSKQCWPFSGHDTPYQINPNPHLQQNRPNHSAEQERIAYLQKKIQTKDEVLAELMAEHVALKEDIGKL
jgi:hypothetical protein